MGLTFQSTPLGLLSDEDAAGIAAHFDTAPEAERPFWAAKLREYDAFRTHYPRPLSPVERQQRLAERERVESLFEDFDAATADAPPASLKIALPEDTPRLKKRLASMAFVQHQTGLAGDALGRDYELARDALAEKLFSGRGKGSDEAFHAEAARWTAVEKDKRQLVSDIADAGMRSALAMGDLLEAPTIQSWQAANKARPGYDMWRAGDYIAQFNEASASAKAAFAPVRAVIDDVFGTLAAGQDVNEPTLEALADTLLKLPADQRKLALYGVKLRAEMLPEREQGEFFDRKLKAFDRMTQRAAGAAVLKAQEGDKRRARAVRDLGDIASGDAPSEDAPNYSARQSLVEDLRNLRQLQIDKSVVGGAWDKFSDGIAQTLPLMLIGIVGTPAALAPLYVSESRATLREGFMQGGFDDDAASEAADGLAPAAGALQTALDLATFGLGRGIPGIRQLQRKAMLSLAESAVKRGAAKAGAFALETGEEMIQEALQDAAPGIVNDLAQALGAETPDIDAWKPFFETLTDPAMLATAMVFSAGAGFRWTMADKARALRDMGMSDAEVVSIVEAPTEAKYREALAVARDGVLKRKGGEAPEVRAAAVREARRERLAATVAQNVEEQQTNREAGLASITRDADGWWLNHDDGNRTRVESADAAVAMRERLRQANTAAEAEAMVALADDWVGREPKARQTFTGEAVRATREGMTAERPGGETRTLDVDPETLRNLREELDLLDRSEGTEAVTGVVMGSNFVTWQQSVAGDAARLVESLDTRTNLGGSVLDQVHERVEATWRAAIETAAITTAESMRFIRAVERATGRTYLSEEPSDAEFRETISSLVVADVLGRRKDGTRLPAGSITAGVNAAINAATDKAERKLLGKFRAFLRAVRAHFRAVFQTAAALNKARRDGKLKAGDQVDQFIDKLLGLDSQTAHDEAVVTEAAKTFGVSDLARSDVKAARNVDLAAFRRRMQQEAAENTESVDPEYTPPEGQAFALAPISRLDAIANRLDASKAPPKERAAMFEKAKGNLEKLGKRWTTAGWEAVGGRAVFKQALGEKRSPKELDKEQAMRQALREDELRDVVYADFQGSLETPEMAKITNHPLIASLIRKKNGKWVGRILAKGTAARKGRQFEGEYDGIDGVPSLVFGGTLEPDLAAQHAYEDGLISAPTPDALWDGIRAAVAQTESARQLLRKAQDEMRNATKQAREEAAAWRKEADAKQSKDFNPHASLMRDLRTLDAVLMAFPAEVRAKVGGFVAVANLKTDEARLKEIQRRVEMLTKETERFLRTEYGREMAALLERSKPAKDEAGKKRVGKAGADVHALFDTVRAAMAWDPVAVGTHVAGLDASLASGNLTAEQEAHAMLERELVQLVGDWKHADAARRKSALDSATAVWTEGYSKWQERLLAKREARDVARTELRMDTGKLEGNPREQQETEEATKTASKIAMNLSSFEEVVATAFGEKSKEGRRLIDLERAASNQKEDAVQEMADSVRDLFTNLASSSQNQWFRSQAHEGDKVHWALKQPSIDTGPKRRKLSQLEAIQATLMWRQADGQRHMEAFGYDQAFVDALEAALTPEAQAVRQFISDRYAAEYPRLNALYRERHGVNLPSNPQYAPLTVKPLNQPATAMVDPVTGLAGGAQGMTPGALRTRSTVAQAEPDFRDALQVFIAHTKQMEHWMAYGDFASEAHAILNNREVTNSIEAAAGKEVSATLKRWVEAFTVGGIRDAQAGMALTETASTVLSRGAQIALVGRASVLLIQSTQLLAARMQVPSGEFWGRFGKLLAGRLGWDAAFKSEYIQRRLAEQPPIVQEIMRAIAAAPPTRLRHEIRRLGSLISGADALFTAGTFAIIYDYQLKLARQDGLSAAEAEARAMAEAERLTDKVAQPTRMAQRSIYEVSATGPASRMIWAFASDARQKLMLGHWAWKNRKENPRRAARTLTTILLMSVAAEVLRSVWRDIRDDDDDSWADLARKASEGDWKGVAGNVFDEKNWHPGRLSLSSILGPFQGLPFFGSVAQSLPFEILGIYHPDGNLLDGATRSAKAIRDFVQLKPFEDDEPVEATVRAVEAILGGAGLISDNLAATASLAHVLADGFKIADAMFDTEGEAEAKADRAAARRLKEERQRIREEMLASFTPEERARWEAAQQAKKDAGKARTRARAAALEGEE